MARYTVVLIASSGVRVPPDRRYQLQGIPVPTGQADVTWFTRYAPEGFESPVPRELWVEVQGEAATIDEAREVLGETGRVLTAIAAIVANSSINDPEVAVAFGSADGLSKREFYQAFLPNETGLPQQARRVDFELLGPTVFALLAHPENGRIHRAIVHYHEALHNWRPGRDLPAVNHLWIAVEALTKVAMRSECRSIGTDENGLAATWGIEKARLDGEVRQRNIFHADAATYGEAKKINDGLEHSFETFPNLHVRASAIRASLADHVRRAIFELLDLEPSLRSQLQAEPLGTVMESHPFRSSLRGHLVGSSETLAEDGRPYPWVDWESTMSSFRQDADGTMVFTPVENMTFRFGPGTTLSGMRFELWGPKPPQQPSDGLKSPTGGPREGPSEAG